MQILTGFCLLFTVPTCIYFWRFMINWEKLDSNQFDKIWEADLYEDKKEDHN